MPIPSGRLSLLFKYSHFSLTRPMIKYFSIKLPLCWEVNDTFTVCRNVNVKDLHFLRSSGPTIL